MSNACAAVPARYRPPMIRTLLVLPLLLAASPAIAEVSAPERRILAATDAGTDYDLALLEKLVAKNSGTRNVEGVKKVRDMVVPELTALGFKATWVPMDSVKRAGHLIAVHKGKAGTTRMLLIGHLDTVFEPISPFQASTREGDQLHGPGAGDDKGGIVVMLAALRAMKTAGTLADANIEVVLTGDEEASGSPISISPRTLSQRASGPTWHSTSKGWWSSTVRTTAPSPAAPRATTRSQPLA